MVLLVSTYPCSIVLRSFPWHAHPQLRPMPEYCALSVLYIPRLKRSPSSMWTKLRSTFPQVERMREWRSSSIVVLRGVMTNCRTREYSHKDKRGTTFWKPIWALIITRTLTNSKSKDEFPGCDDAVQKTGVVANHARDDGQFYSTQKIQRWGHQQVALRLKGCEGSVGQGKRYSESETGHAQHQVLLLVRRHLTLQMDKRTRISTTQQHLTHADEYHHDDWTRTEDDIGNGTTLQQPVQVQRGGRHDQPAKSIDDAHSKKASIVDSAVWRRLWTDAKRLATLGKPPCAIVAILLWQENPRQRRRWRQRRRRKRRRRHTTLPHVNNLQLTTANKRGQTATSVSATHSLRGTTSPFQDR